MNTPTTPDIDLLRLRGEIILEEDEDIVVIEREWFDEYLFILTDKTDRKRREK